VTPYYRSGSPGAIEVSLQKNDIVYIVFDMIFDAFLYTEFDEFQRIQGIVMFPKELGDLVPQLRVVAEFHRSHRYIG